jgi:hypothetical protein
VSVSVLKKKPEFLEKFAAPSIFEYYWPLKSCKLWFIF